MDVIINLCHTHFSPITEKDMAKFEQSLKNHPTLSKIFNKKIKHNENTCNIISTNDIMKNDKHQHSNGQYFTTSPLLQNMVYQFILNNPKKILEPSVGRGDLVSYITKIDKNITFDMFEIDTTIKMLDGIDTNHIVYGDFLLQNINTKYQTIIGNPPYVRTKKGNLYIDFIEKCYYLLNEHGELIFIVPTDFFKLTSASKLLDNMAKNGHFTHIYHPNNENLFDNASIDIMVFRYSKNCKTKITIFNDQPKYLINSNGLITFSDKPKNKTQIISDLFDVYVGMVSAKDEIYRNSQFGNITLLNGKDRTDKFIYIKSFPTGNELLNQYLIKNKNLLINRKIRKFNESNWFEWGAPRNVKIIENEMGNPCIYINNMTRNHIVAFKDKIQYFGGNLIMLKPKQNNINLDTIVDFINNDHFKKNFMYSGRFKIGHRQLCNSLLDIPTNLNWLAYPEKITT